MTSDSPSAGVLSLCSEALQLRAGRPVRPRMAIVHPTDRCNHRCAGCEYAGLHEAGPAQIQGERLLQLVDELADLGATSVLFSGGGEPTLHDALPEAIRRAHERDLLCGLFTNGARVRGIADSVARYATFVRVSIDAATPETYSRIRGVRSETFGRLLADIRHVLERRAHVESGLEVSLKFLVRPSNLGEIPAFIRLASELGVDGVQFNPLRGGPEEPSPSQIEEARKHVESARRRHAELRIRGSMSPIRSKVRIPCWLSPLRVVISADGGVQLCNYFNHRRATHTYGNVNQQSLHDIWFGEAHRRALESIDPTECERFDCRFHKLNVELTDLVERRRTEFAFV